MTQDRKNIKQREKIKKKDWQASHKLVGFSLIALSSGRGDSSPGPCATPLPPRSRVLDSVRTNEERNRSGIDRLLRGGEKRGRKEGWRYAVRGMMREKSKEKDKCKKMRKTESDCIRRATEKLKE